MVMSQRPRAPDYSTLKNSSSDDMNILTFTRLDTVLSIQQSLSTMSTVPKLPQLSSTSESWGPPATVPAELRFNEVPYAPFFKGDKLGKVADWTAEATKDGKDQRKQQYGRGFRDPYHAYGASSASYFTNEEEDDVSSFSLVDSSTKAVPKSRGQNAVLRTGGRGNANPRTGGRFGQNSNAPSAAGGAKSAAPQRNNQWNNNNARRKGGNWKDFDKPNRNREPSVAIQDDWELIQNIGFSELQKLSFETQTAPEDVGLYGSLHYYNRALDKPIINSPLKPLDRQVFNISTSDDPVIQELSSKHAGLIYATDSIISLLMCATKTINPWDIVINKKNGQVFLDKRENGPLDFINVDENAADTPLDVPEKDLINSTSKLAVEATYINQNFEANAVLDNTNYDLEKPNPFVTGQSSEPLLSRGYRYRQYNLTDDIEAGESIPLVIRTEIDAVQEGPSGPQFVTIKALNEYGGSTGVLDWKNRFVNQRGAIVADEMKRNLCKLSRWTVEALLADAASMKIGFVSRATPKDNTKHSIIGVLARNPAQFSSQLNLNLTNGWGIVKSVVNIATALDDGKYVLLRDPNNPAVKLYKVPETFE